MNDDKFNKLLDKCKANEQSSMVARLMGQVGLLRKTDYDWLKRVIASKEAMSDDEGIEQLKFVVPILLADLSGDDLVYNDLLPGQANDSFFIEHEGNVSVIISTLGKNPIVTIAPVTDMGCMKDKKALSLSEFQDRIEHLCDFYNKELT